MEYRSWALGSNLILALALASATAHAADRNTQGQRDKADQLEREAKTLRAGAEARFVAEEAECKRNLLVNDCIHGAKTRRLEQIELARIKEKEKAVIEREMRRSEYTDRQAKRLEKHIREGAPPAVVIQGAPDRPEIKTTP